MTHSRKTDLLQGGLPFATTQWSLVHAAAAPDAVPEMMLQLSVRYWYPVYAYLRRCGHGADAAHELAQRFFTRFTATGPALTGDAGRFREHLLAELGRYLTTPVDVSAAPALAAPLAATELEARYAAEHVGVGAEEQFRRSFALSLLAHAQQRLRNEAGRVGKLALFEALERYIALEPTAIELERIGATRAMHPLLVTMALQRMRERFRELVDDELGLTVSAADQREEERRILLAALAPRAA